MFSCELVFQHAWRATRSEMDQLVDTMVSSLTVSGVKKLSIGGDITEGTLHLQFANPAETDVDTDSDDSLVAVAIVVRALNSARVSAPGWPDDDVIDEAIAQVKVREFGLIAA